MARGIIRKLDELGRVTVPIEFRNTANIKTGDRVGIELKGNVIHFVLPANMSNFIGIDRPVDELGRIVLPMEIRRVLMLGVGQKVDMYFEEGALFLQKVGCHYCGSSEKLIEYKGVNTCRECIMDMHGLICSLE